MAKDEETTVALDNYPDEEFKPKKCCGCPMACDFSQIFRCPAFLKIVEIVLDFLMLMLSCAVIIQRIDEEGDKFMCAGAFLAFIVCVILSLISSIILLCFYITVYQSKTNQRLKSWVKSLDLVSGIFMLIGFTVILYILIKWQIRAINTTGESIQYLTEMCVISSFAFMNATLYFLIECVK